MHECKHEAKIAKMDTNIEWIRGNMEKRNGMLDNHIKESEHFRRCVTKNTVWRHVFKWILTAQMGVLTWIISVYLKQRFF